MPSLQGVHEENTYRAYHICLSGRIGKESGVNIVLLASILKH
jgi:hypothetical protein